jgi:hypothetical protein
MSTQLARATELDLVMQADAMGLLLNSTDRKLLKASGWKPIRETSGEELLRDCRSLVANAMRDLGITKAPDAYDGARFMDIVREHFGEMTIVDLKNAFELFITGDLDEYVPRDSKGRVIDHYQQFSARWYIGIIRAYRMRQQAARRTVVGKLELAKRYEADRSRNPIADRVQMVEVLKALVVKIACGAQPVYVITAQAELVLKRLKILPSFVGVTTADVIEARKRLGRNKDSAVVSGIRMVMERGTVPEDVQAVAQNIALRRVLHDEAMRLGSDEVARRFDWLLNEYRKRDAQA